MTYAGWEKKYPGYIIIKKEGYFYSAHGRSADIISDYTGYKLGYIDGLSITGSPITDNMVKALDSINASYIVVEADGAISEKREGKNYKDIPKKEASEQERKQMEYEALLEQKGKLCEDLVRIEECLTTIAEASRPGARVHHVKFGDGIIKMSDESSISIDFGEDYGIKTLELLQSIMNELITIEGLDTVLIEDNRELLQNKNSIRMEYDKTIKALSK